ncbi:MAG: hypothetical protein ACP5GW_06730, partial [Caldisericaceae bacterium]
CNVTHKVVPASVLFGSEFHFEEVRSFTEIYSKHFSGNYIPRIDSILLSPVNSEEIYVLSGDSLFKSDNSGSFWPH